MKFNSPPYLTRKSSRTPIDLDIQHLVWHGNIFYNLEIIKIFKYIFLVEICF